jgi:hypothetical protein
MRAAKRAHVRDLTSDAKAARSVRIDSAKRVLSAGGEV